MNKKHPLGLALAGPLLALGACQGGAVDEVALDLTGQRGALITDAAEGATICIDANASFGCDIDEPQTVTDADGRYELDALFSEGGAYADASVIAVLKGDANDKTKSVTLAALRGRPELISGATNLAHHLTTGKKGVTAKEAWSTLKETYRLGEATELTADAHAAQTRLGRLAGYLESYARVSASGTESAAERETALRAVLQTSVDANVFLDALASPPQAAGGLQLLSAPGIVPADNFENMTFTQGMKFGAGWNDVQSTVIGNTSCLEPYTITSNKNFAEKFRLIRIKDKSDLTEELSISGKVALDLSTFDATIEGEYYDLMTLNENYVYILAQLEISLRDFHIQNPVMTLDGYGNCAEDQQDSNGRCPGVDGAPGLLNNRNGTVGGTVRNAFKRPDNEGIELFRKKCGDRYINTITTGGSYYGMLVLKTSSQQEKEKIGAKLDAKIKAFSVEGKLDLLFTQLSEEENTEIVIMKRGVGGGDTVVVGPAELEADIAKFKQNVCAVYPNGCDAQVDPNVEYDWTKAPFRVKYETYEGTTHEIQQGGDAARDREIMDTYVHWTNEYSALRNSIYNMLQVPIYYNGVTGREQELLDRVGELNTQMAIVRQLYNQCNKSILRVCSDINQGTVFAGHGLKTIVQLMGANADQGWAKLPSVKMRYPKNCAVYKDVFKMDAEDGEKFLYMNADKTKPYFMYCAGMKTAAPTDYLSLANFDPTSETPATNFSRFSGFPAVEGGEPSTMTTTYERLKVLVNPQSLKVDVAGQQAFRSTTGGPLRDPATGVVYTAAPYATAKSCVSLGQSVHANIDLAGTPFMLNSNLTFSVPEKQFELMSNPKSWYLAKQDAEARGGRLPIIYDEAENAMFTTALHGYAQAWIGLHATLVAPREFSWPDGTSDYYNFANPDTGYLNVLPTSRNDYCGALRSSDGLWDTPFCRTVARPYFVQYRKVTGEGVAIGDFENGTEGQMYDLKVGSQLGCGSLIPTVQLSLQYSPEKAAQMPELNP